MLEETNPVVLVLEPKSKAQTGPEVVTTCARMLMMLPDETVAVPDVWVTPAMDAVVRGDLRRGTDDR